MITGNHVCFGCLSERTKDEACLLCGWEHESGPVSHMHLKPGTILQGKYLIGRALGQGGFGVTYLALDLNLDVKLAIKEYLPQDLAARSQGNTDIAVHSGALNSHYYEGLEKFLQEAKTLARFEGHPNIVSVRDFFKANETAYFVMSYIEGITFKEYIKEKGGKIPVDQAINIMMPVLEALKEVHKYNILHRDISPDNIFMTAKGRIILIDFGAARQAIKDKGRSMSIMMKPGFTPEEQYRSKGQQGPWTDLYALGATIYRSISGQMPPESLDRLVDDDLIPPTSLGVSIDPLIEKSLLKSMAVMGKDRFQSAEEFQHALVVGMTEESSEESEVFEPLELQTAPYTEREVSSLGSRKIIMGAGILVVGFVFLLLVFWWFMDADPLEESDNHQAIAQIEESQGYHENTGDTAEENISVETSESQVDGLIVGYDLNQAVRDSGHTDLLGISEETLFNMYGQPFDTFYWEGGLFYEYQDFYAMVDEYTRDRMVVVIGLRELPGVSVNASFDEVKRSYGAPEWDGIGSSNNSHLLHYDVHQQYAVVFEGFTERKVDLITIHSMYLEYDYEDVDLGFDSDYNEYDQALSNLYDLGEELWQKWVLVQVGTMVWAEPNYHSSTLGEITGDRDFYVTNYEVDLDFNLWIQLELIDENGNKVYGWILY